MKWVLAILGCFFAVSVCAAGEPAHRIISLAPNLTELVYAVGAQAALIAVDESSDYPLAAKRLPKVANYRDLDIEKILSLHPDLVLAWSGGNPKVQLDQLKKLGIPVQLFKMTRLLDIPKAMLKIGYLTGQEKLAQQKAKAFMAVYQAEKARAEYQPVVTVFFELFDQPLLTLTKNSLVDDMITTCGGRNVFANAWGAAPSVSVEAVIQARPQVMIGLTPGWQAAWKPWPRIPAVNSNRMFSVDPDTVLRATDRSLLGLREICADIGTLSHQRERVPISA